ncbi:phosphoribosylamine--glycine ligase [Candidatus Peregrinibacteria bacterium]|jgi:phosphoribosylamine--glycine ligase|nr:phosphoribosylamine--glycine ligase [Candidatus Peregrinibacteria bacterium]MBT3598454.1 phosphoribosylamine--glycine ligase [Candidatus Peregrinibacteria bacterium]MBT4367115.1 phosphoribosylamine--glycine ligase [Candidatus Peregrinibacteria bacterium]MBT4585467.1 phosphoribosylamine--glycine ligase [Candidatus Peregrinibacteria bacterium]MBT6730877.1 phosphoribosylamine--glycine ligase [Candidatus Peregrinibacteria bacterium]
MQILLLTSSARGHAIAESLSKSSHNPDIISISPRSNPGIKKIAKQEYVSDLMDFDSALDIAKKHDIDFAFIGPDDPIGAGMADALDSIGIPSVAPTKSLARVETSKAFTRNLLEQYGINASPKFMSFDRADPELLSKYIEQDLSGEFVVKYDGLRGGKGVKISGEHLNSTEEGVKYAIECIEECGQTVIEEKLNGVEFSLISFTSGTLVVDTPAVQDHKRAYNGDTGPNTGGMGTVSDANHSLPFIEQRHLDRAKEINRQVAAALQEQCGVPYKGILYGGFIITREGVKLIEYNARFGDPEALNILPLLKTDFVDICQAILTNSLTDDLVSFHEKATVCKYITPEGYPNNKDQKGQQIEFPEMPENAELFYGDLTEDSNGNLILGGSRTAGIVGIGDTIEEAQAIAQGLCEQVKGPVRFRDDIGTKELMQQRVNTVKHLFS